MFRSVLVMAILACLVLAVVPAQAETWDLTSSFNAATPSQMGQFTLQDVNQPPGGGYQFNTVASCLGGNLDYWYYNNDYQYGEVYKNVSGANYSMYGVFDYNPGEIACVSYGRGHGWLEQTLKFSWIAPQDMTVVVTGSMEGISHSSYYANNMHAVQLQVAHGADTLVADSIEGYRGGNGVAAFGPKPTTSFATGPVSVLAGESIDYFVWQYDDNNTYNSHAFTGITFTVTSQDTPEPGSMLALGSGLVGLVGFAIRRKRA